MVNNISELKEGAVPLGIMKRRVFQLNKNMIIIDVGATGSSKSYRNLRRMELWYKRILKKPMSPENICFSVEELLQRLNSGQLVKGDYIALEEGGVNVGSLDFQNKISKVFNYVVQSFRNLNLILEINLPYMSMLNKTTRMLAHYIEESLSIDKAKNQALAKPFLLQVNQETGKVYKHFPKVLIDGMYEPVEVVGYNLPSKEIRDAYELRKESFVRGLISGGLNTIEMKDKGALTPFQMQILSFWKQGIFNHRIISEKLSCFPQKVSDNVKYMRHKGYLIEEWDKKGSHKGIPPARKLNSMKYKNLLHQKQNESTNAN